MMVRYEDREGVGIFCPAIAVEFFYQSVAEPDRVCAGTIQKIPNKNCISLSRELYYTASLNGSVPNPNVARLQSDLLVLSVLERSSNEQNLGLLFVRIVLAGLGRTADHAIGDHHQDVYHAQNNTDTAS